jgi:hypothetical protein
MTSFNNATTAQTRAAEEYLRKKFGVVAMDALDPYLLLVCEQMPRLDHVRTLLAGVLLYGSLGARQTGRRSRAQRGGGAMEKDEYPIDEELNKGFE